MKKYTLPNGLRVMLEHVPTSRSVSFGIWVKTGSRNEHDHNNGISHLIEHMLFKGTATYTARAIAEAFDGIGGEINAFTAKEYTCYYVKVLDQHLPKAMAILSDMFFNSLITEEDLVKEKNVIFEEIAMYEDTPDDLVHDLIAKASYGSHALGYPVAGVRSHLEKLKAHDLTDYMDTHYHVNNTVISMAGHIGNNVIEMVDYYFGKFLNVKKATEYEEPKFLGGQLFHRKKTEQDHICLALPGYGIKDDRRFAMILLNNAIGGGMSSRLFQEVRENRGLAYSIYSYHSAHADSGLFTIYAGTTQKQTAEVLEVTLSVLADMMNKGLSETELSKGKEQMKGSLILGLESTSSRMNRMGRNELMLGKHDSLDEIIAHIEAVQLEDVHQLTADLFAQPFALSLVGQSDEPLTKFRRDQLVDN